MRDLNLTILIITLNVNGMKTLIKRHIVGLSKKEVQLYAA